MPIKIVAVGKKHEAWVADGIERYQQRLKRPFNVEWVLLPHSAQKGDSARQEESERILSHVMDEEYTLLLDERGQLIDSPALSKLLLAPLEASQKVTIIIGGAYGATTAVHQRADFVLSLSPLVFPHQLVRLILIEQLYRAQQIEGNGPYHHE